MACVGAEASSIWANNSDAIVIASEIQVDCCLALPVEGGRDLRFVGEVVLIGSNRHLKLIMNSFGKNFHADSGIRR